MVKPARWIHDSSFCFSINDQFYLQYFLDMSSLREHLFWSCWYRVFTCFPALGNCHSPRTTRQVPVVRKSESEKLRSMRSCRRVLCLRVSFDVNSLCKVIPGSWPTEFVRWQLPGGWVSSVLLCRRHRHRMPADRRDQGFSEGLGYFSLLEGGDARPSR